MTERLDKIISTFPIPFYTSSRVLYEEDIEALELPGRVKCVPSEERNALLDGAATLASIKPELALRLLVNCERVLSQVGAGNLKAFVELVLDVYDAKGLNEALKVLDNPVSHPASVRMPGRATTFEQVSGVLTYFLRSLGPEDLTLQKSDCCYTDTRSIYLPASVSFFKEESLNFLLYKIMLVAAYYQIKKGIFRARGAKEQGLANFLSSFDDPALARDIYSLLDLIETEMAVGEDLPGLYADLKKIKLLVARRRGRKGHLTEKTSALESMISAWLSGTSNQMLEDLPEKLAREGVPGLTGHIYRSTERLDGPYEPLEPLPFGVELRPEEAERSMRRRREATKLEFQEELAKLLSELGECNTKEIRFADKDLQPIESDRAGIRELPRFILADGRAIPVPEAMSKIIEKIYEDVGMIPSSYLAVAEEMSGHHFRSLCRMPEGTGYFLSENDPDVHVLDEWDYRRQGYRKRWVLMREMVPTEEDPQFAPRVFSMHGGMIGKIKRQFERLRQAQKRLRRQKEGEDIDFDALVESFSDIRAGRAGSEFVFSRQARDRRSVSSIFLIDLSGSTRGWINEVERTALLILSEALSILGDRFGIYGFSGQTRKRCELYRIKDMNEKYDDLLRARIGGLKAREWTRMGPPIRHVARILSKEHSRTRLLITLSDGKPDDYDYYKGDYAIEDTRHALEEAKALGVKPFCITIDRAEHSYLSYMYGEGNYIFVDDISKLPFKVPEIYRRLTT